MTKAYQNRINELVDEHIERINKELSEMNGTAHGRRLRSCSAYVFQTENYIILRSYNTIIAAIDKHTDTLIDFLRKVYGYTATSAQHISKFAKDYGCGIWGCRETLTYR